MFFYILKRRLATDTVIGDRGDLGSFAAADARMICPRSLHGDAQTPAQLERILRQSGLNDRWLVQFARDGQLLPVKPWGHRCCRIPLSQGSIAIVWATLKHPRLMYDCDFLAFGPPD